MKPFLLLMLAVAISIAIIPVMAKFAHHLGMIDKPDPRKIHHHAIPRVGGWGIVFGSLIAIALLIPLTPVLSSYLMGAVVLFIVGVLDDAFELGHYPKFGGQFIAVAFPIVMGDLYVQRIPFLDWYELPPEIGIPFTFFAMVGMINAINHSDGLDGLAGGETLLSLLVMIFLAYVVDGTTTVEICAAIIGGILGFLKFNTHPAKVFMGDSGSTFLGYSLGFLAVFLTQRVHTALSPALPLLLLGLPVIDILAVLAQRIYHGMNWFKASRNHIHHRLLDIGFDHYETVVMIYSIQAVFVISAAVIPYEKDITITVLYLAVCTAVFGFLLTAEKTGWKCHKNSKRSELSQFIGRLNTSRTLAKLPMLLIVSAVPAYILYGSLYVNSIPGDFGIASIVLFAGLLIDFVVGNGKVTLLLRGIVYVTAIFIVYLLTQEQLDHGIGVFPIEFWYFVFLASATALAVRFGSYHSFGTTPMDFLLLFGVIAIVIFTRKSLEDSWISTMVIKGMVMMYACELVLSITKKNLNALTLSTLIALGILSFRGSIS